MGSNHAWGAMVMAVAMATAAPAGAVPFFQAPSTYGASDWTNYVRFADLDGDGDPDLLVPSCGGFFTSPVPGPFVVYENQDGSLVDVTSAALGEVPNLPVRVVAVGDVDGDGDIDLYLPSAGGGVDRLYVNAGDGTFVDEAPTRLPAGTSSRSAGARFGDLDGDGDLDLLVAQGYAAPDEPLAELYVNDGTGIFTLATGALPATGPGTDPDDVDLLDFDRDFDLDILINAHAGKSSLWRNDGDGSFTDVTAQMAGPATNNFHYNPSACDVDGDGDLDLWVDNIGGGFDEQLLINDGAGTFSDETGTRVSGNAGADDNGVMCVDVDDDGDFDAVIPSLNDNERILFNDGSGVFSAGSDDGFPTVGDPTLWIDFADVDGDGRLDAFTGQGEGANTVNRLYLGDSTNQPVDSTLPVIVAQQAAPSTVGAYSSVTLRFAVSERAVTDSGPPLARSFARVVDGSSQSEVEARFVGGDLFQVSVPTFFPDSTLQISLCAVDLAGNEACGAAQEVYVETYEVTTVGATAASVGVGGGTASAGGSSASAGGAPAAGPVAVENGGCGCRTKPRRGGGGGWAMGLLVLGLGFARRRRCAAATVRTVRASGS